MDELRLRLIDLMIDDREQIDELYLGVNYFRRDNCLMKRRAEYRLFQVVACLRELETEGLIARHVSRGAGMDCDELCCEFGVTERGSATWNQNVSVLERLYEEE